MVTSRKAFTNLPALSSHLPRLHHASGSHQTAARVAQDACRVLIPLASSTDHGPVIGGAAAGLAVTEDGLGRRASTCWPVDILHSISACQGVGSCSSRSGHQLARRPVLCSGHTDQQQQEGHRQNSTCLQAAASTTQGILGANLLKLCKMPDAAKPWHTLSA